MIERWLGAGFDLVYIPAETSVMGENKHDDHPQVPGLNAMAGFAVFLLISLMAIVLFLQFKFGTPTAP